MFKALKALPEFKAHKELLEPKALKAQQVHKVL